MSQAVDLLNSLSGDDVATYTANTEEEHIVVGKDRFIRIPDSLKRLGVQHDKDIETVTFDCPRYWDKHDLSQMVIYINYVLPGGEDGKYRAQNVTTIGSTIHFDWTISNNVTQYKGQISFLICAVTTDADGNEELHWNSELNQEAYISEGLECSESPIHNYPDIITHLLTRMDEVEAIATPEAMQTYTDTWLEANRARILAEIEAKGAATLDTIPKDYTETYHMAEEGVRTKADAIVSSVQGERIVVSDSSDDHISGLRVFGKTTQEYTTGKNLFDVSQIVGHTSLINIGGIISVITPATSTAISTNKKLSDLAPLLEVGGTYILTFDTTGTSNYIYLEGENRLWTSGNSLTITQTMLDSTVMLYASGVSTVAKISNMMIRSATTDETYEVYSGGVASPSPMMTQPMSSIQNPSISWYGKNLFNCPDAVISVTDEYYHKIDTVFEPIIGETYTLSMDVATDVFPFAINIGCGQTTYSSDMTPKVSGSYSQNGRVTLTFVWQPTPEQLSKNYTKLFIRAPRYGSQTTFNATVSNIQLELGSTATEYEPYRESQKLEIPYTLDGIPVTSDGNFTDENGQQWVRDEIDFKRGVYVQNIQTVILDGTENISREARSNNTYRFVIRQYNPIRSKADIGGYCSHFKYDIAPIGVNDINDVLSLWNTGYPYCRCDRFDSVEAMSQWLAEQYAAGTPVTIKAVREVPVEIPLTAEEIEAFKALHTNYPHTTVMNDAGAHMELKYNADTKTYVDNGIKQTVSEVMEAIENGSY